MQVIHYVMLALTALVAVCPVVGQQVPRAAPVCAIVASIAGALLGVLAQVSPPVQTAKKTADTKPAGFARVSLLALLAGLALVGCAFFRAAEPPLADCGKAILDDAAAGLTLAQIEAKDGGRCGLDAARIIALLLESKDPRVAGSRAVGEGRAIGAAVAAHPQSP